MIDKLIVLLFQDVTCYDYSLYRKITNLKQALN